MDKAEVLSKIIVMTADAESLYRDYLKPSNKSTFDDDITIAFFHLHEMISFFKDSKEKPISHVIFDDPF